jgi:hypothetical protein
MSTIKLRGKVNFPANVTATGGIGVEKVAGVWTIHPEFSDLDTVLASAVSDPTTQQIWIYDPINDSYAVLTLAGLGDALYKMTSTTSLAIGTGSKVFTTQTGKDVGVGQFVLIASDADPATNYMLGQVTAYSGATLTVNVTTIGGSGTLADWTIRVSGNTGAAGATGATGGIRQAYSDTTTDTDPGPGVFQFNHGTPTSATAAYLDNVDAGGATVSGIWDLYDDSGSTVKGFIHFEKSSDATVWAQFQVTGSVVDGTGYRKLTLANGVGSGAFTDTDTFSIAFYRTGDPGALGGSTGSTDNRLLRADGTGGATVKSSAVAIDDSGNVTGVAAIEVNSVATYGNLPQNSKSAAYTTVLGDANKHLFHPDADTTARVWTIDSNANVPYEVGTSLTFINGNGAGALTIAITSDTMRLAGAGTTGSRTLAANGMATAVKVATTEWKIAGTGLT